MLCFIIAPLGPGLITSQDTGATTPFNEIETSDSKSSMHLNPAKSNSAPKDGAAEIENTLNGSLSGLIAGICCPHELVITYL